MENLKDITSTYFEDDFSDDDYVFYEEEYFDEDEIWKTDIPQEINRKPVVKVINNSAKIPELQVVGRDGYIYISKINFFSNLNNLHGLVLLLSTIAKIQTIQRI